jgi:protocatechuate 3,4-dioxygenase beta subunit
MTQISRRRALATFGTVAAGALLGACGDDQQDSRAATTEVPTQEGDTATVQTRTDSSELAALFDESAACRVTPEQTAGPFYFEADKIRTDIREDREGQPLELALRVRDGDCRPVRDAVVEIWHCDAGGQYSGFEQASQGGAAGGGRSDRETYLRGAQVTNADGVVRFETIYPGWYAGRTVHVHALVVVDRKTALTTQLYFDEPTSARVFRRPPYAAHSGQQTRNADDPIFRPETVLTLRRRGDGHLGLLTLDLA